MKYIDEYRDKKKIQEVAEKIKGIAGKGPITLMEVCGTHTMNIFRHGLKKLLPPNINLVSGPGCPVCVTPMDYIDRAIEYAKIKGVIITTFGDIMRVPGSRRHSLIAEKGEGACVRVVYSPMDALKMAMANPSRHVIFLGIGFETTAPLIAACIKEAKRRKIKNFSVLCGHKLIPPAMKALVNDNRLKIDGFICPGHVSAITGAKGYEFIAKRHKIPCVIAGFEPFDVLQAVFMLVKQIKEGIAEVQIQYSRVVKYEGNCMAQEATKDVFDVIDSKWRGIGKIAESGLKIKRAYKYFDTESRMKISIKKGTEPKGCICGEILQGIKNPSDCNLFGRVCTPENPQGACMVSSEGTCAAWYKYSS